MSDGIGQVATVAPVTPQMGIAPQGATAGARASLLPEPELAVGSMESLYALMAEASAQQQKNGHATVDAKFKAKKEAFEKYKAEAAKAEEDQKSGSFWKTVAKVGMVVAAVAATVCSYGTAGPVLVAVAIALSAGGFLVSETKCFGDKASAWIGAGLSLCGALLTGGAGAGGVAANVATSASSTAAMAQGAQTVTETVHQHDADLDMREAKAAQQQMRRLQDAIEEVITSLQDDKEAKDRGAETINNIIQTKSDTLLLSAGTGSGGRA